MTMRADDGMTMRGGDVKTMRADDGMTMRDGTAA
jgi:hypothetical protein